MKKIHAFRLESLFACALMALPFGAMAGEGPYLGVEGGANFERFESALSDSKFDTGYVLGLTGGYSFKNGWRPELELDFRRNALNAFGGNGNVSGHENAYTAMGNIWYDFKSSSGLFATLHPYVGGGIGYANAAVKNYTTPAYTPGIYLGQNDLFAYQLGAGLGYDITRNLTASLDYRALSTTVGDVLDRPAHDEASRRYTAQSVMLGLRYSFGDAFKTLAAAAAPAAAVAATPAAKPAPVADSDGDGVPDNLDKCPNTPHGFKVDANGCIVQQTIVLRGVNFEYNSDHLTAPSRDSLNEVAAALKGQPGLHVELDGYTDSRGSAAYNKRLSQKRAESVRQYLVDMGVGGENLTAKGFGPAHPVASNNTADGRAENRRVEFVVLNAPEHVKVVNENPTAQSKDAALRDGAPVAKKSAKKKHHAKKKQQ